MAFVWLLIAMLFLISLDFLYLIVKRMRLIRKLKRQSDEVRLCRNRLRSVFLPDGKTDLIVKKGEKSYAITILTTPFRRVSYHFCNSERMEIYTINKGYFLIHFRRGSMVSLERAFRIKKYKLKLDIQQEPQNFVIPNPAPPLLTKVQGTEIQVLGNGDSLFGKTRICGLKYFLEEVIPNIKEDA